MRQSLQITTKKRIGSWFIMVVAMMLLGSIHSYAEKLTEDELNDIKNQYFFFQNRYYKSNVWDCQRNPAFPEYIDANDPGKGYRDWHLKGLAAPNNAVTGTDIDFGPESDRYLQFDIKNLESEKDSIADNNNNNNQLVIILKLYEADGTLVSTVSKYGSVYGLGKNAKGIFYEQEGHYGTFFTRDNYNKGDDITYKPEVGKVKYLSELGFLSTWTFDPVLGTLTSFRDGGTITLNNVVNNDGKLSIGDNANFSGSLDLAGTISDADNNIYEIVALNASALTGSNLKNLSLPKSITSIDATAFADATIETLHFRNEELLPEANAFGLANKSTAFVYIPKDKLSAYHTENADTTVTNWQGFRYILEEGGTVYDINYEGDYKNISTLPTKAPVGQLFTFQINSIPDSTLRVTTNATIDMSELFCYDSRSKKFAVKLANAPADNKLVINIAVKANSYLFDSGKKTITSIKDNTIAVNVTADNTNLTIGGNTATTLPKALDLTGIIVDASGLEYTLDTIGVNAFKDVELESLTLPESISKIDAGAFAGATLDTLHIQNETPLTGDSIGADAFALANKDTVIVYVPKGTLHAYHTENTDTTVTNWQGFRYILEEEGKTCAISYEGNYKGISTLPTLVPVGQLFTFRIDSVPNATLAVTTTVPINEPDIFSYDSISEKFVVKLATVPAENKLTVKIEVTVKPILADNDKGLIINASDTYKEGEDGELKDFNGTINAQDVEGLKIAGPDSINIKVEKTTVKAGAGTTVTSGTTAILTLSGTNDLGIVVNSGNLTFEKGTNLTLGNTRIQNDSVFTDNTGLITEVTGGAPIKVDNPADIMNKEFTIEQGSSQNVTIETSSEEEGATLNFAWERWNDTSLKWETYAVALALRSNSKNNSVKLSEAGQYRCQMSSTVGNVVSTLTSYITIKVVKTPPPAPDPIYYAVSLPEVEGVTLSLSSGRYSIEEGDYFIFTLTLDAGYDQSKPVVKANGEEIMPDALGRYMIVVDNDLEITITGIVKNIPTNIDGVGIATVKVWGADGVLHVHTPQAADVHVFNYSGSLVKAIKMASGDNNIYVPKGHYIVTVGGETFKVGL